MQQIWTGISNPCGQIVHIESTGAHPGLTISVLDENLIDDPDQSCGAVPENPLADWNAFVSQDTDGIPDQRHRADRAWCKP